jgi:L-lactate dehydrogenase
LAIEAGALWQPFRPPLEFAQATPRHIDQHPQKEEPMLHTTSQLTKIAIIGTGHVGASCAYALQLRGLASEIVLIDSDIERAEGEAMDINHGSLFTQSVRVRAGEASDCRDAGIIVLTAGASQTPGESRLELLKRNAALSRRLVPELVRHNREAILIVVSNPVDVLTYVAWQASGLPAGKVIGSGTILDTARFRYLLSQHFSIEPRSIHAYIIGEHGDSQIPVWSLANIAGMKLDQFCRLNDRMLDAKDREDIAMNTRRAAYEIIRRKGATYYAIAAGVARIIEAIVRDENSVLTVSSSVNGRHGLDQVALSLPSTINSSGIASTLELPLSRGEQARLRRSAGILREAIASLEEASPPADER